MLPAKQTIPLGDLLQKLAMHSYEDMRLLLEAMPQQTAMIRAEKLDELLEKSKRRFTQIYSILNWLQPEDVRQYLHSIMALQNDVSQETTRLNTKLDTLFYMQAGEQTQFISPLNAKRIRTIDSVVAAEIISTGTYPFLPASIFNSSLAVSTALSVPTNSQTRKEPPESESEGCSDLPNKLELVIRSKIFTSLPIPDCFTQVSFDKESGMLLLKCPDLFEVTLSLSELSVEGYWQVIHFKLLVKPHEEEKIDFEFDLEEVEGNVLPILKGISTDLIQTEENEESAYLSTLFLLCRHASLSMTLRLIYIQALAVIRTCYYNNAEAIFFETNTFQILTLRLWSSSPSTGKRGLKRKLITSIGVDGDQKEESSKQYEYEVLIYLNRSPGKGVLKALLKSHDSSKDADDRNPASIELDMIDADLHINDNTGSAIGDKFATSKIATTQLDISRCLKDGVNFSLLLNKVIYRCALRRLEFIYSVIQTTPAGIEAIKQGMQVEISPEDVTLTLSLRGYCEVFIRVDVRTGLFVVSSQVISLDMSDRIKAICSKFQKELLVVLQVEKASTSKILPHSVVPPPTQGVDSMEVESSDNFFSLPSISPFAKILMSLGPLCSAMFLSKWVLEISLLPHDLGDEGTVRCPNVNLQWYQHFHTTDDKRADPVSNDLGDDDTISISSAFTNADFGGDDVATLQGVLYPLYSWTDRVYREIEKGTENAQQDCFDAQFTCFIALSVEGEKQDFSTFSEYILVYNPVDSTCPSIPSLRLPTLLYKDRLMTLTSPSELFGIINRRTCASRQITIDLQMRMASLISPASSFPSHLVGPPLFDTKYLPFNFQTKRWSFNLSSSIVETVAKNATIFKNGCSTSHEHLFTYCPVSSTFQSSTFSLSSVNCENGENVALDSNFREYVYDKKVVYAIYDLESGSFHVLIMISGPASFLSVDQIKNYISSNQKDLHSVDILTPSIPGCDVVLSVDHNRAVLIKVHGWNSRSPPPVNIAMKLTHCALTNFSHIISMLGSYEAPISLPHATPKELFDDGVKVIPRAGFNMDVSFPLCRDMEMSVSLLFLSLFEEHIFSKRQMMTGESVWKDILSVKMSSKKQNSIGTHYFPTPLLLNCILEYFKLQVDACFFSESKEEKMACRQSIFDELISPSSSRFNWFGTIEKAAINSLPLVMFVHSLQSCINRRNDLFFRSIAPTGDEQARQESEALCDKIMCFKIHAFSIDKISVLLKVQKKMKSDMPSQILLSKVNDPESCVSPNIFSKNIQLDLNIDVASSASLKVVKIESSVFHLENVNIGNMRNETHVQAVLDNFVNGLFQQ